MQVQTVGVALEICARGHCSTSVSSTEGISAWTTSHSSALGFCARARSSYMVGSHLCVLGESTDDQ